ncbi:MAG: hypothetical protein RUMPE_00253 [Eubacteriales bacterium SKADARSKE-1]|nr:hypothetical protein [Eubacteriales bacterium SKADARSKE-1]
MKKDKKINAKDNLEINANSLKDVSGGAGYLNSQSYSKSKISVSIPPPPPGREEAFREYKQKLRDSGIDVQS